MDLNERTHLANITITTYLDAERYLNKALAKEKKRDRAFIAEQAAAVDLLDAECRVRLGPDPKPSNKTVRTLMKVAANPWHPNRQGAIDTLSGTLTKGAFVRTITKIGR
jgi:hypothetical protein